MRFVFVTGLSGGGKSTARKMLEDQGYFCVDNLPFAMIPIFMEMAYAGAGKMDKVALCVDARSGSDLGELEHILEEVTVKGYPYEILFMECDDSVLIKRYKETRRAHPMSPKGRIETGISRERKALAFLKSHADYIIDTTNLLTRELKEELDRIFVQNKEYNSLIVNVMSFGFKNGIPQDADLVFDVRFLPNPYYIDELKNLTGNDKEVQDFVMNCEEAVTFKDKLVDMVRFLIPNYVKEGKYQLLIAIGCTGGKHRSVTLANELYGALKDQGSYGLNIIHRDIKVGK